MLERGRLETETKTNMKRRIIIIIFLQNIVHHLLVRARDEQSLHDVLLLEDSGDRGSRLCHVLWTGSVCCVLFLWPHHDWFSGRNQQMLLMSERLI